MKRFLRISIIVIVGICVYWLTWTPSLKGISEKAKQAVIASEKNKCPNNDFTHVVHFPKAWKKDYTGTPGPYPQTCMNTVSSFYSPDANWAQCAWFVANHKRLGFAETDDPKPGDIVVFFKEHGVAKHTGLYVGKSLFGPLMNHSDGGKKPHNYQKHFPIKLYIFGSTNYKSHKYYTYIGDGKNA